MVVIAFITDFGLRDWFVGTMKGVVLGLAPTAGLVDITHDIPAGDIRAGAFALASACRFFPKGTIHVAVVDPGVGSARRAIGVRTRDYFFIGPDNGVLSWALRNEKEISARYLQNDQYFRKPISQTFHGRDLFAPAAAHLSRGVPISALGPVAEDYVRLEWPGLEVSGEAVTGAVIYVDRFGNAITNIDAHAIDAFHGRRVSVFAGARRLGWVEDYYSAVARGRTVAVRGSSGFLEIAVNGGSAARQLKLKAGSVVSVR